MIAYMQLYRFSPIESKDTLFEAVAYIVRKSAELSQKIVGSLLPISSVTVYAHYPREYEYLCSLVKTLGHSVGENIGPRVVLYEPIVVDGYRVTHLRIRTPDPYHTHVGGNDYDIEDYINFKNVHLATHPNNLRLLIRQNYELIEFFDPDFDVLGYVLSEPGRSKTGK